MPKMTLKYEGIPFLLAIMSLSGCIERVYQNPVDPLLHERIAITGLRIDASDDEFSEGYRLDVEAHLYEAGTDIFLACTAGGLRNVDTANVIYTVAAGFVKAAEPHSVLTMQDLPGKLVYVQVFDTDETKSCPDHVKGVDDVLGTSPSFYLQSLEQPRIFSFDLVSYLRLDSIPH